MSERYFIDKIACARAAAINASSLQARALAQQQVHDWGLILRGGRRAGRGQSDPIALWQDELSKEVAEDLGGVLDGWARMKAAMPAPSTRPASAPKPELTPVERRWRVGGVMAAVVLIATASVMQLQPILWKTGGPTREPAPAPVAGTQSRTAAAVAVNVMGIASPATAAEPAPPATVAADPPRTETPRPAPRPVRKASHYKTTPADVLAADRRLRRSYARAERAGVPYHRMVQYHHRWARIRRQSGHDPRQMVTRFEALSREISAASASRKRT